VSDGKVLSKFSIMRVHVAKKFGGLVHQWAVDQHVIDRTAATSTTAATAAPRAAAAADRPSPPPNTIPEHGRVCQIPLPTS
jgi:hypothetical protein